MPIQRIPSSVIRDIPRPVVSAIEVQRPVTSVTPPPVTRGIRPPVVDVPDVVIDYPIIDVPTEEEFQGQMDPPKPEVQAPPPDTRDLPTPRPVETQPSVEVGGLDIPIPDPGPIVAAGAMAIATTAAALGATVVFTQVKTAMDPVLKNITSRFTKRKVKIKKTKIVLHFIPDDESGNVQVLEYSHKGVRIVADDIDKIEQYLRDQVEIDSFYEYDNKLIIDDILKKQFSKEGAKRFSRHFQSPKSVAKKLGARFSF